MRIKGKKNLRLLSALLVLGLATTGIALQLSNMIFFSIDVEASPYVLSQAVAFPGTVDTITVASGEFRARAPTTDETVYLHIQCDTLAIDWTQIQFNLEELASTTAGITEVGWNSMDATGHISIILDMNNGYLFVDFRLDLRCSIVTSLTFSAWLENIA